MGQEWDRVVYLGSLDEGPGRVWSDAGRWIGHVESYEDDYWEEPDREWWETVDEAIAWGRTRAPIVLIRIGNTHYSAGEIHAEDDEDQPLPLWPPASYPAHTASLRGHS